MATSILFYYIHNIMKRTIYCLYNKYFPIIQHTPPVWQRVFTEKPIIFNSTIYAYITELFLYIFGIFLMLQDIGNH